MNFSGIMNRLDERVGVKRVPIRNSRNVDEAQQHRERATAKRALQDDLLLSGVSYSYSSRKENTVDCMSLLLSEGGPKRIDPPRKKTRKKMRYSR